MKIFDSSQMRELDQYTIQNEHIASIDLMERASARFVEAFTSHYPEKKQIHVFAGPGNNGGDGLAIARLLTFEDYPVNCYLVNPGKRLSPDCERNWKRLRLRSFYSVVFSKITNSLPDFSIGKDDLIIDGLFGSGLNKPLEGIYAELVQYLNSIDNEVVSIDVPSGLFCEDNSLNDFETIIKASRTFTFQSPKLSFLLPESGAYAGNWEVIDIGLSTEKINATDTPYYYTRDEDILPLLPKRDKFAYKNQFGHALIVAGTRGKSGAAVLSAKACLRSGAGLVTVFVPAAIEPVIQTALPEAMTLADPHPEHITSLPNLAAYTGIGIGPGLGTNEDTVRALAEILTEYAKPVVLDADAMNIISRHEEIRRLIPPGSILTPHIGEFERFAGESTWGCERLEKVRELASSLNCNIVLKGAYTAICSPSGQVRFNSTGNPGMATAGSGDVLTGIITGLLAKGYSSFDAARIGVYLHGLAGDKAAVRRSEESMIAGDIIDEM